MPDAICHESSEDTRPTVERVPDERAERHLGLSIPDGGQDGHPGSYDRFKQTKEEAVRGH